MFRKCSILECMITDQDRSLQAKHGIKSLSTILMKHLPGLGQCWPKFLPFTMYCYNTFCSPNLNRFSPYELVIGRKPKLLIDLKTDPNVKASGTFKEYYEQLSKRLEYLEKLLFVFRMKKSSMLNKDGTFSYVNQET